MYVFNRPDSQLCVGRRMSQRENFSGVRAGKFDGNLHTKLNCNGLWRVYLMLNDNEYDDNDSDIALHINTYFTWAYFKHAQDDENRNQNLVTLSQFCHFQFIVSTLECTSRWMTSRR